MPPLDGVTVVALEQAVAAPFATRQLADLGARVIKIERPGGGDFARGYDRTVRGQSSYFVWLNRGKESIELDLKTADGRAVLGALLARADVLVQNLAPGAAERLGLGAGELRKRHPRLITCSISGYGPDGPYRHKKAYDLLVQCEAGLLSVTGTPGEPAKAGISVADIATGMYAYSGVLTALYERERTGGGTSLDVAMLDALGEWMSQPFYYSVYGGQPTRRTGARHASIAPYGPYTAADGSQVFIGLQNDREWAVLCERILSLAGPHSRRPVRNQPRPRRPRRRADADHRGGAACHPRRRAHRAARRSRHRQRPPAHTRGVRYPSPARGTRPVARGGLPWRPDPGAAAPGHRGWPRGSDGRYPGARPAHRRHPCGTPVSTPRTGRRGFQPLRHAGRAGPVTAGRQRSPAAARSGTGLGRPK